MRLIHALGAVVVALGLSGAAPALAQRGEAKPIPISLGLGVTDVLGDFDFVVGKSGLEIVWITRAAARPEDGQLWYTHQDLRTGAVSAASLVTTAREGPVRILAADNGLHLVVSNKLRHFWLQAGSSTWQELPPLLPDYGGFGSLDCESFDVIADRDALIAVYVRIVRKPGTAPTSWPLGVQVVRWSSQGTSKPVVVREHHRDLAVRQPAPKLLLDRDALTLIYPINVVVRDAPNAAVRGISGVVFFSTSKDRGATWTNPSQIGSTDGRTGDGITQPDAARCGHKFVVFWKCGGLSVITGAPGKWSSSRPFGSHLTWIGWSDASSPVVACSPEGRGKVFWIDDRYRRDDRTPTNPFAGNPFADHEWANNDLLSLPLQYFDRPATGVEEPDRLTRDMSYVSQVRALVANGMIYVMWSGRAKVGKTPEAFGEPPDLFTRRFPL